MKKILLTALSCAVLFSCSPVSQEQKPAGPDDKTTQSDDPVNPGSKDPEASVDPGSSDPAGPDFSPEPWYETNFWERTDRQKMGLRGPV